VQEAIAAAVAAEREACKSILWDLVEEYEDAVRQLEGQPDKEVELADKWLILLGRRDALDAIRARAGGEEAP